MARYFATTRTWELDVRQELVDATCDRPTIDPNWRHTDSNGHEHHYDKGTHRYPTLDYIVDAEHWCDGTEGFALHDPHMQVDEDHYECKVCREVVVPGVIPGGTPQFIPGTRSATLKGVNDQGVTVTVRVTEDEYLSLHAADDTVDPDDPQPTERDLMAQRIIDGAPQERTLSMEWSGR